MFFFLMGPNVEACSLQSRRFLTKTRRYIDRGCNLEKQRKRPRWWDNVIPENNSWIVLQNTPVLQARRPE